MDLSSREALTQRIRDSVNIVDLVGSYVALRPAGANLKGLCPFHADKDPSLHVHPGKQIFKCFACGAGGDIFTFVQLRERVDFLQARALLAERAGISLESDTGGGTNGPSKVEIARVNAWAAGLFRKQLLGNAGSAARAYQDRRGIRPEVSDAFGLGYAPDSFEFMRRAGQQARHSPALLEAAGLIRPGQRGGHYDTFRDRLMFPIVDAADRCIGFGGRALGDDPAKYLNTPEGQLFEKRRNLFGLNHARDAITRNRRAIVVEGYMDCLMAHQYGFTETVAALGTAFTDEQAQLLRRYADTVVLVFDSDTAGQAAADRALSVSLLQRLDVRLARVPTGKDPCDYLLAEGADAFTRLLNESATALEFKWRLVADRYQTSESGPARRRAIEEYLEQIATWANAGAVDAIQRGLILNQIGKLLALPVDELHGRLAMTERRLVRGPAQVGRADANAGPLPSGLEPDVRQAAMRQLVEVLLNEPQWVETVGDVLANGEIVDPLMARVTAEVLRWCRAGLEVEYWRLDELIGRLGDPALARVVTDLQAAGESRGLFAATIESALERIRECDHVARMTAAAREVPEARRKADRQAEDRALLELHEGARSHCGFSPLSRVPRPG